MILLQPCVKCWDSTYVSSTCHVKFPSVLRMQKNYYSKMHWGLQTGLLSSPFLFPSPLSPSLLPLSFPSSLPLSFPPSLLSFLLSYL